ncbi:MAG: calcium-binding protein [bacterium]|nr:calcium-binding protein [bacterium]
MRSKTKTFLSVNLGAILLIMAMAGPVMGLPDCDRIGWCFEDCTCDSSCSQQCCDDPYTVSTCGAAGAFCLTSPLCDGVCRCATRIYGSGSGDTLHGNSNHNCIYAYGGDDTAYGYAGDDKLYGDSGNDTLKGGTGNDCLYGGSGSDHLDGESGHDYCTQGETYVSCND